MELKKGLILMTASLLVVNSIGVFAEDILDLGDTAQTTNTNTGTNTTTNDNTQTLDLGTDTTQTTQTTQTETQTTQTTQQVNTTYEKVDENAYKFTFPIPDANKTYGVKFKDVTGDITLATVDVNNGQISDNLKKSLSIVVVDSQGNKNVYQIDDVNTTPVVIKKGSKVYLVYSPQDGVDNSAELSLLNNELKVYMKEITQPEKWGELSYQNGDVVLTNTQDYKEAQINYQPTVKETKTKKSLTKKDTGPVENLVMLFGLILILVLAGYGFVKVRE